MYTLTLVVLVSLTIEFIAILYLPLVSAFGIWNNALCDDVF
jgi:hypothetical protein